MDLHRLRVLLELCRLGSMNAVAEAMHTSTSTVSQQIATLAREAGTPLVEPVGRRVRLTPAGRRLADHAVTILAAVDAARLDLDPDAEPSGSVRVAGFATAIRRSLLPAVADLATTAPDVEMRIHEFEPLEAVDLILRDEVDLALVYDYNLAPLSLSDDVVTWPLWQVPWGLGVPATGRRTNRATDLAEYADHDWIVNSRNTADEEAVAVLAALAGFTPRLSHRADSLSLVEDLVASGLGVGLLPEQPAPRPQVRVLPLRGPGIRLRAHAVVARGRETWAPLALVLARLATRASPGSPARRPRTASRGAGGRRS
jgi:DNA-binding transcriptional LysR family regulator